MPIAVPNDMTIQIAPAPPPRPIMVNEQTNQTVCVELDRTAIPGRYIQRAFFGVHVASCVGAPPDEATPYLFIVGFDQMQGISPAREAGINIGDRIVQFNGCNVSAEELKIRMRTYVAGNAAEFIVVRVQGRRFVPLKILVPTVRQLHRTERANVCQDIGLKPARL